MRCAKDVMQTRVVKVGTQDPLISAYRLFTTEEISGAPVVDELGNVVGVLSLRDLVRDHETEDPGTESRLEFYREWDGHRSPDIDFGSEPPAEQLISKTVADAMSEGVISVSPDAPIADIVETVLVNRIHRVMVVEKGEEGGALVGIISLFDLVSLLA